MEDKVRLTVKTSLSPEGIPLVQAPEDFQIKFYRANNLVLVILNPKLFLEIKEGCQKRNLKVEDVIYGAILKAKEALQTK